MSANSDMCNKYVLNHTLSSTIARPVVVSFLFAYNNCSQMWTIVRMHQIAHEIWKSTVSLSMTKSCTRHYCTWVFLVTTGRT